MATNLFGRGIDIERVNIVINYDFPTAEGSEGKVRFQFTTGTNCVKQWLPAQVGGEAPADQYLHRVGRAGVYCIKLGGRLSRITPRFSCRPFRYKGFGHIVCVVT